MVIESGYVPEKYDIVWLDLNPTLGHEQAHLRPVVILTPKSYNQRIGMIIGCPITSKIKGYPFEIKIDEGKIQGAVLTDQLRSMDWRKRKIKFIQKTSQGLSEEIEQNIKMLLFSSSST